MRSNTEGWSNQELNDRIEEVESMLEAIRPIVIEITEGKGRFNTDPHIHCANTVEDMKALSDFMTGTLEKLEGIERIESMFLMPEPE